MTQSNVKIAITGGIGSGKSTVARFLCKLGYTVVSCDEIYSELLKDAEFANKIGEEFDGVLSDGKIDRKKLAEIVFNDEKQLLNLNSITHPAIMNAVSKKLSECKLCFCEVPLLFENGFESLFDGVIVVFRSESQRINSVVKRDGINAESVKKRINSQINYDNFDFAKYYVLHNDGNFDELERNTEDLIKKIVKEFKIF